MTKDEYEAYEQKPYSPDLGCFSTACLTTDNQHLLRVDELK